MAGLPVLLCGAGNFIKIWSASWQHEIQHTRAWDKYVHKFYLCFSVHNAKQKV